MRTSRAGSSGGIRIAQKLVRSRSGFTLVELLVVLLLIGLAASFVAPTLLPERADAASSFVQLINYARTTAVRRSELVYLEITPTGAWRLDGAASLNEGPLAEGTLPSWSGASGTLAVSPLGSCGFEVDGTTLDDSAIDLLTCEVRSP